MEGFPKPSAERVPTRKEITDALHKLTQRGANMEKVIEIAGREAVIDELDEMIYHDGADLALEYGIQLNDPGLTRRAASVVSKSGAYSEESKEIAKKIMGPFPL